MNSRKKKSSDKPKMIQRSVPFDSHLLELMKDQKNLEEVKSIIAKENLFNVTDNMKETLLHHAANFGNVEVAKYLIDSGSIIDAQNFRKATPLMSAYKSFDEGGRVGEILIEAGASIYMKDETHSCVASSVLLCDEWLEKKNGRFFLKVLQVDCSNDREKIAKSLSRARWSLPKVIQLGDSEITKIMLDRGYISKKKVNKIDCDDTDQTALHLAVRNIDVGNVKVLLENNANVNVVNINDRTPLSYVYIPKKYEDDEYYDDYEDHDFYDDDDDDDVPEHSEERLLILKMLLERTRKKDIDKHEVKNILRYGNVEAIKLLFQSNINPMCATDLDKNEAIHSLVKNRNPGVFEELRSQKFDVNARDEDDDTPLMNAVGSYVPNAVKFLLNEGANIDAVNLKGYTALFFATYFTSKKEDLAKECVQMLLEHGANVQIEVVDGVDGPTIFDEILEHRTFSMGELILANLALQETKGMFITELIRGKIDSNERFKNFFELCKQQLKMKFYESITLCDLLTASDKKLELHVCNEEFLLKIQDSITALANNYYFHSLLQKRISKAKDTVLLKNAAIPVISKLTEISYDRFPHIMDNIVDRLEELDMKNLMNV